MRKEIIGLIAGLGLVYSQASSATAGEMKPSAKQSTTTTTMHHTHTTTVEHKQTTAPTAHKHHHHHKHHAQHQHYKHHRKHGAANSKTDSLHQKQFSKTHKNIQKPVSYESDYAPKGAKSNHEVMNHSSLDQSKHSISDNGIGRDHR